MSNKLPFQVIHTSGCDANHPGKELEIHGPTARGWQSSRFCVYPQEIILSLKEPSKIMKLQILSHQYNIASKIEMFTAYPISPGSRSLNGIRFRRLGYVVLSANEETDFKARELKSVHLDAEGQFIKLIVHQNHVNKMNLYNQVSIVAINILGQSLMKKSDGNDNYFNFRTTDDLISSYMNKVNNENPLTASVSQNRIEDGKIISPLDDLAFDMYMDPETAQLIRRLEEKKRQAVLEERFDYAKKLKETMGDLYKVGEKLGRFEVAKRRAVQMEDFETAKSKKVQSDEYRLHVYQQLNIFDLLELNQAANEDHHTRNDIGNMHTPVATPRHASPEVRLPPVLNGKKTTQAEKDKVVTPLPSLTIINNDDRPLPALQGKSPAVTSEPIPDEPVREGEMDLAALTEKEEREAGVIINVFGMLMTRKLFSKSWKYRQESLQYFFNEITNPSDNMLEHTSINVCRALVAALKKSLKDQVFVVMQESVDLLRKLLLEYIPEKRLSKSELSRAVEKLLPIVLNRTGDMVPRSRNMMFNTTIEIANASEIKGLNVVPNIVCEPIKSKKQIPWRLIKSQIEMIKALLPTFGLAVKNGFSIDSVMRILLTSLQHQNSEVRDASLSCIMEVYKIVKEPIKKYFPSDDEKSRKNPLYVKLFDGFDKADGKLTAAERKAQDVRLKEEAEKSKEAQVKALQAQLHELRSLAQNAVNQEAGTSKENGVKGTDDLKPLPVVSVESKIPNREPSRRQLKVNSPKKNSIKPDVDRLCIFCNEQNDDFTDEQLDIHYWKSCPMLQRCSSCAEVVEISGMNEHLLTECEQKQKFMKCKQCQKAILVSEEKDHLETEQCREADPSNLKNRCHLCGVSVGDGDENWKSHLIGHCKVNSERLQKSGLKKPGTAKVANKTPVKSDGRGRGHVTGVRGRGFPTKLPSKVPTRKK